MSDVYHSIFLYIILIYNVRTKYVLFNQVVNRINGVMVSVFRLSVEHLGSNPVQVITKAMKLIFASLFR